jgi:hypothetical protein
MLLLVSSRMAIWTVGRGGWAGSLAPADPQRTTPEKAASHAKTTALRFMGFPPKDEKTVARRQDHG